jgi:hypothetical protein
MQALVRVSGAYSKHVSALPSFPPAFLQMRGADIIWTWTPVRSSAALATRDMMNDARHSAPRPAPSVTAFGRRINLPQSRALRIVIGVALIIFGIFGFLPVLGFWMIPLGLFVLSYDFARVRRWRRRLAVKYGRRNRPQS